MKLSKKQLKLFQFFQNLGETIQKAKIFNTDGETYEKNDVLLI
jgi:hypothetical protein